MKLMNVNEEGLKSLISKKAILITIFIITLVTLAGCKQEAVREGKIAADTVDIVPEMSISECLAQIRQTNPEMSDQDANDNCYTLEAVNKGDKSLCDRVSQGLRANCLAQFG